MPNNRRIFMMGPGEFFMDQIFPVIEAFIHMKAGIELMIDLEAPDSICSKCLLDAEGKFDVLALADITDDLIEIQSFRNFWYRLALGPDTVSGTGIASRSDINPDDESFMAFCESEGIHFSQA